MRLTRWLRSVAWRPRPWERWHVSPRLVDATTDTCTWCGQGRADAVRDGQATHLNVRPYCARQREALRAQGRRS